MPIPMSKDKYRVSDDGDQEQFS